MDFLSNQWKQVSYGVKENLETLINTDVLRTLCEAGVWQHLATPLNPHFEALQIQQKEYFLLSYIAEAPKTASIAVLKASLGEDKYFIYLLVSVVLPTFLSKEGVPLTNHIIARKNSAYTLSVKNFHLCQSNTYKKIYFLGKLIYNNKRCTASGDARILFLSELTEISVKTDKEDENYGITSKMARYGLFGNGK